MDTKQNTQWEDEDRRYVKESEYLLRAFTNVYESYRFSLRPEHKEMCRILDADIKYIEDKKKFIEEMYAQSH